MGTDFRIGTPGWREHHIRQYLETDGAVGHYMDLSALGAGPDAPALLLQTIGRKSGVARLVGLNYGEDEEGYVVVASLGGAPRHPAWFRNLVACPAVAFQVGPRKFRGRAVVTAGGRRAQLFARMARRFPFYLDYQASTDREIPVIVLVPEGDIGLLPD